MEWKACLARWLRAVGAIKECDERCVQEAHARVTDDVKPQWRAAVGTSLVDAAQRRRCVDLSPRRSWKPVRWCAAVCGVCGRIITAMPHPHTARVRGYRGHTSMAVVCLRRPSRKRGPTSATDTRKHGMVRTLTSLQVTRMRREWLSNSFRIRPRRLGKD